MIPVTKPFLPPKEEYLKILDEIWNRNWLTNNGPVLVELEEKLKEFLDVHNLLFVTNGTIAIQLAIKALGLKGDIITTPFSYVATTSSIVWEQCRPVFVDIDGTNFNINPKLIEERITENTKAILATHVFGNPCKIDEISAIAKRYNLKVIYDAAHCFGSKYHGESVFKFGDISTTSFHATKLFSTVEGGAVFSQDKELFSKMRFHRNFGHMSPTEFAMVGINGKNSELHAAMGLANLKYMNAILERRKEQWLRYFGKLKKYPVQLLSIPEEVDFNYSYFPVVFDSEEKLLQVINSLNNHSIHPRRYFYPSLNTLNYVDGFECPVSESIAKRVLTLPLYHNLDNSSIDQIIRIIIDCCRW